MMTCTSTIQSSSQPTIPAYNVNVDGNKVYDFNAFSYTPSNSVNCKIKYTLDITKADGSDVSFTLNDSKTTFTFSQTPSLTFAQNNIYTTSGSYKLLLTGLLDGTTQTATVEIPFVINLNCKGSPISWNGSSQVFQNISYSMWDPSSVTNWLWTDVNIDPSQITTQPPSGQTCGRVFLQIRNQDTTLLESSLFFYDQTSFAAGLRTLTGSAIVGSYNLSVFFMYEKSLTDGLYFTNRKDFQVVVTDFCALQTDSKVTVNAFEPVKYLLGQTKISVDITENGRVTFDPSYCPWMATVTTYQANGTTAVAISSLVFTIIGNQTVQSPSGILIEIFQASYEDNLSVQGYFKVEVKYSLGFVFSTQSYQSNKSQQFALTISSCASQFQPPSGLTTVSYTQLDPKLFIDVTGTLLDSNCPYALTISTIIPSVIDLTGNFQVGIYVNSYDRTKLGSYQASLTYTWNQSLNTQIVNFTIKITDNCASQISVQPNQSFSYQLMDAGKTLTLNPTISQSYCTFDFAYHSGSNTKLDKILTFTPRFNLDQNSVIQLTLSQSEYDSSPVGNYSVVFNFSWSISSSETVTVLIDITDACKTDVNPIDQATITYQLMSSSQSMSVLPRASLSYCTFQIQHTAGSVGSLLTWSDFQGTKNDQAQVSIFTEMYLRDYVGDNQLTFKYTWSKSETRDVIITISIEDGCITDLVPQIPSDFNYILMQEKQSVSVQVQTSFDYCLFSIKLLSAVKSGADIKTANIWQWNDQTDVTRAVKIFFGAIQTIYEPSFVGEYILTFQFAWSRFQTQTVTSKVIISDDCLAAVQMPAITDKSYKALDSALSINVNPTAQASFNYCKYSIQAVIRKSSVVVDDPAFKFVAKNDILITQTAQILIQVTSIPSSSYGIFDIEVNFAKSNSDFEYRFTFKVEILDPCLTATTSSSLLHNQKYGINTSAVEYVYPAFLISPSQCALNYAYTSSDSTKTDPFITFDQSLRKFKFQSSGLDLSVFGGNYTLTIAALNQNNDQIASGTFVFSITDPCEAALILFQKSVFIDKKYDFPLEPVVYNWVDPFTTSNYSEAQCGALMFEFYESNIAIDSSKLFFVNRVQKTFTVNSDNDRTQIGLHTVVLKSWHSNFINSLTEFSFKVHVDSSKCDATALTSSGISLNGVLVGNSLNYIIGQEQKIYSLEFLTGIQGCPLTSLRLISDKDVSSVVFIEPKHRRQLSQFANTPSKQIRVRIGGNNSKEGFYPFKIEAIAGQILTLEFTIKVLFPCSITRLFAPENPSDLIYVGEAAKVINWQAFKHDGLTDFCDFKFSYTLRTQRINNSPKFPSDLMHFMPDMNEIIVAGFVVNNGTYIVSIDAKLNDNSNSQASISFRIQFIEGQNMKPPNYILLGPLLTKQEKQAQLELTFDHIATKPTGRIPIATPGKKDRKQQKQPSESSPLLLLKNIDRWGIVTLGCTQKLQKRSDWNGTDFQSALNVSIKPAYDQSVENLEFTWMFKDTRHNSVRLQLNFTAPLLVSAASSYDRLQVETNLTQLNYLFYVEGTSFTEEQFLYHSIPLLLDDGTLSEALQSAGNTIVATTGGIVMGSLASNFFLSGTLGFLWGMIHALQIIVHLPMINVRFPANVSMFFSKLLTIANFKVMNVDNLIDKLNQYMGVKPEFTNENYAENGFSSNSIPKNLGIVSIVAIVLGVLAGLLALAHKLLEKCKCGNFILRIFWQRLFWKAPIRLALESYLGFSIATLISYQVQYWGQWRDTVGSMCNVTILSLLCFLPIYILWFLLKNLNDVDKQDFQLKYNALYLNLNSEDERNLLFTSLFCSRRMLFALAITFLRKWPVFQIMVLVHSTTMTMCFNAYYQPFVNKVLNYLEIMNEVTILILIYHMIVFTDFVESRSVQYQLGYSVCIFTVLNICINVIFLFSNLATTYLMRLKKSFYACLRARKIKQRHLRKKATSQLMIELKEVQKIKKEEYEAEEIYQEHKRTACKIMNQSGVKGENENDQNCQLEPFDDNNSSVPGLLNNTINSEYENDTIQSKETPRKSSQESLMFISPVHEFKLSSFNPKKKGAIKDFETTNVAQINVMMAASVFEKSLQ